MKVLWGFNGFDYVKKIWVGVLVECNGTDADAFALARAQHRRLTNLRYVSYLPIWVPDIYSSWAVWQCLKHEGVFRLPAFMDTADNLVARRRVGLGRPIVLDTIKFVGQFNPLDWCAHEWGVGITMEDIDLAVREGCVWTPGHVRWKEHSAAVHAARVAYFVFEAQRGVVLDKIDVGMESFPGGSRCVVVDGYHRLLSIMYRHVPVFAAMDYTNPMFNRTAVLSLRPDSKLV